MTNMVHIQVFLERTRTSTVFKVEANQVILQVIFKNIKTKPVIFMQQPENKQIVYNIEYSKLVILFPNIMQDCRRWSENKLKRLLYMTKYPLWLRRMLLVWELINRMSALLFIMLCQ